MSQNTDIHDTTPEAQDVSGTQAPEAVLDIPDDEFEAMPFPDDEPVQQDIESQTDDDQSDDLEDTVSQSGPDDDTQPEKDASLEDTSTEPTDDAESLKSSDKVDSSDVTDEPDTTDTDKETNPEETDSIDYKAEYEKLLAPFKANGREIKVNSIEEARQLMQMGANYNKKMAALKPNLRILKTLEANNLLDEEKINFAIELIQKKPEAITKLIKEANIDPLEIDPESAKDYTPQDYRVDESVIELDQVLDEISATDTFQQTVEAVNALDEKSRGLIATQPVYLKVLNEHIQTGIYNQIMNVVEKERALGRLGGLSDLEAYKIVGDALHAQGALKPSYPNAASDQATQQSQLQPQTPAQTRQVDQQKVAAKKKAAGVTKGRTAKPANEFDPLAMSDEEFEKLVGSGLY